MTINLKKRDFKKLRRIALRRQGLTTGSSFGRGKKGTIAAIEHLGYVQIDSISVIARAHHHVLFSRVPNYQPVMLDQLLKERRVFEYWTHAAAFLPMDSYRFSLPYKHAIKSGKHHWYKNPDYKLMAQILARIEQEGPLRSRDIRGEKASGGGWWDWKPAKRALEQLYFQGDLMVSEREGFQKTYDLPNRVLPSSVDRSMPNYAEYAKFLLDQQLRCHGFVSAKGISYQRRDNELRQAIRRETDHRVQRNELIVLTGPCGDSYFAEPKLLDQPAPPVPAEVRILSPFDNAVIQRDRLKHLFHFDYQLECYVPAAKRKFGYFSLPLLYQDRFIGRVDCKAWRGERRLQVKSLHLELDNQDEKSLVSALGQSLKAFATFQGTDQFTIDHIYPKGLDGRVRHSLPT